MKVISFIVILLLVISCKVKQESNPSLFIQVLGVAQDAGYPQLGCTKECCKAVYDGKETKKHVVSLALVNNADSTFHLFEATPDITEQLTALQSHLSKKDLLRLLFFSRMRISVITQDLCILEEKQ